MGDKFPAMNDPYGGVPTTEPLTIGAGGDPMFTREGRNVRGGIPYGDQIDTNEKSMNRWYKFRPAARARLMAATRRALGR